MKNHDNTFGTNAEIRSYVHRTVFAMNKEQDNVTLKDCFIVEERLSLISTMGTLLDNDHEEAVEFLIEHHDVNLEAPLDAFCVQEERRLGPPHSNER